jgi:DNA repair ATPase RecN
MLVNTDPESLEHIATVINTATNEISAAVQKMQSALSSAQWNDNVRRKFESDFAVLISDLKKFQSEAPKTVQYLKTKANQLKQFQA